MSVCGYSYRTVANALLVGTAVLYAIIFVAQFWYDGEVWFNAVYWMAQSALIGSVADWFAVTALFRKPLGFPYHTALVPRNKERLINGVIHLVQTRMLTKERCQRWMEEIQFLPIIERYLLSPAGRKTCEEALQQGLSMMWQGMSQQEWSRWGVTLIRGFLGRRQVVPVFQHVLLDLCEHNRYESMVVQVISQVQERIQHPAMVTWLTAVVAEEVQRKKKNFLADFFISMSEVTDVINHRELAQAILQEAYIMLEEWKQPNSAERQTWLRQWVEPIRRLPQNKPVVQALECGWHRWVAEQDWEALMGDYVYPFVERWVYADDEQRPATLLLNMGVSLWTVYGMDEGLRQRIEQTIHHVLQYLLEHGYDMLSQVMHDVLHGLTQHKFIHFVESKVEDDLSWIRINGALVGAVCGLLVWSLLTYVYEPFLAMFT